MAVLTPSGPYVVLYLGSHFDELTVLRGRLPSGWTLLPIGALLNRMARTLRPVFLNLDAAVLRPDAPRDWWDATHLAERNPLASNLSLNFARLATLREILAQQPRCLVLCDDRALCRLFYAEIKRMGHRVSWAKRGGRLPAVERLRAAGTIVRCLARGLLVRIRGLVEFRRRQQLLRNLRRTRPLPLTALRGSQLLFVSWGRAENFPAGAALPFDTYLPRLAEAARDGAITFAYLMRTLPGADFRGFVRAALSCPLPVLVFEELVPISSALAAALSSLSLPFRLPSVRLAGQDITALLRFEAWRELGSWDVVTAFGHRVACRSLSRLGVRPEVMIHPYEHQPWEKLLRAGLRQWLPDTREIGVQHSPFAFDYLSLFPSRRELATDRAPDRLLVPGVGYAEWFRAEGYPADRLATIGAPRYERARHATRAGGETVLCCTGIELNESIELAATAAIASRGLGCPLVVNYHPVTDTEFRAALRAEVARLSDDCDHVQFIDAPAAQLINSARVVLYSTSAASFDALLAGKPAIYVGRAAALDYDKVPNGLALRCDGAADLRAKLDAIFSSGAPLPVDSTTLSRWLAPFSAQAFRDSLASIIRSERAA